MFLRSSRLYLAASVAAAILAALSLFLYLRGLQSRMAQGGRLVALVVAARDLAAGEAVDPSSLRLVDFPERYLPPGTFTNPAELAGSVLRIAVGEGEPLYASALLLPGEGGLALSARERDFRAYPLPASAVAFPAGELREGKRVDILSLADDSAILLLENVEVMCVRGRSAAFTEGGAGVADDSSACIILKLTPEESCRLAAAHERGEVELLLRPD
jgi:Flp pilus assembly protein CpaB